ncbi:MAG TPA: metallophosphoesterase [Acidimicrobiales bacterium]|nr:metallophosphoesterase [Acidimicrobiales bacterium]
MRPCCNFSRRQFLRWSAVAAATPIVAGLEDVGRAYGLTNAVKNNPALPVNLEVVTTTESSVVLTWFTGDPTRIDTFGRMAPMPADTEVAIRDVRTGLARTVYHDAHQTPYHYVELSGLDEQTRYTVIARSNGVPALPANSFHGSPIGTSGLSDEPGAVTFRTTAALHGKLLTTIALCNDLHLGEKVAGLVKTVAGQGLPPGISQLPGKAPYPEIMATALARETRQRGAQYLLAAGDVSSEASPTDLHRAKELLDGFGVYEQDYFVARGNHDRAHDTAEVAGCSVVPGHPHRHDCFRDEFDGDEPAYLSRRIGELRVIGIDTYDTIGNGSFHGSIGEEQFAWLTNELRSDPERPTIVFGHHPLVLDATTNAAPPLLYGLPADQAKRLTALYRHAPGVFLHHAGHTHRNKLASSPAAPNVLFQEVAAVKEYPGGFHLLRVHEHGFALNFYKFRDPAAQEWSERSRPEYLGAAPSYTFGNARDRNSVTTSSTLRL